MSLRRLQSWLEPDRTTLVLFWLAGLVFCGLELSHLPVSPSIQADSGGYLAFDDYRPPGYPWLLQLHQSLFGGLRYLPHTQTGVFFLGTMVLATAVGVLARNILLAFLTLFIAIHFAPATDYFGVMTETAYAGFVCLAAGAFGLGVRCRSLGALAVTGLFIGLAAVTRTTGYLFIPVFALCLAVLVLLGRERPWRAALAVLPIAAVLVAGAAYTKVHHGEFRISGYSGMSWLGHGLMVAKPLPATDPMSALNWAAEGAGPAQADFARIKDPWLKMLALRQYYYRLRFTGLYEALETRWPAFHATMSEFERGKLVGRLGKAYVRSNPGRYAQLVAIDYLGLWTVPRYVTAEERARLEEEVRRLGTLAMITDFAATPLGQIEDLQLVPQARLKRDVWAVRLVSLGFFLVTAAAGVMLLLRRIAFRADSFVPALFLALAVHLNYAATALVESGGERFVFPTWPLMVAGLFLIPALLITRNHGSARRRPAG